MWQYTYNLRGIYETPALTTAPESAQAFAQSLEITESARSAGRTLLTEKESKDLLAAYGIPDFNVKSFRTTNVLRWEYKPGSTLFVVWQQGRDESSPYGDFRFNRDFGRAFTTPGTNVFLVKVSRWLNF